MEGFNQSLAVVVGINEYTSGITKLRNATRDAEAVGKILQDHEYQVSLFLDEKAGFDRMKELLTVELPKKIGADDRLLFYFAGHGVATDSDDGPAGYILPFDAEFEDEKKFIYMGDLQKWLSELDCRHLLLILDCCFAGAFRWSSNRNFAPVPKVIHQERYAYFIKDRAWQVITSADYDQKASDGETHSPFASAFIKGLEGEADIFPSAQASPDGVITATELYLYLRQQVEGIPGSKRHFQTPGLWQFKKHNKGEFIFLSPKHELNLPPAPPLNEENNPYRGLNSYEENHKNLFFGREKVVKSLVGQVLENPLTVVVGASGTGKSSVVKAGLIPCLREVAAADWQILPILRPGKAPLRALLNLFNSVDDSNESGVAENEIESDSAIPDILKIFSKKLGQTASLLVIDQLEELITLCRNKDEREKFLQILSLIVKNFSEKIRVVVTVRADFEPQLLNSPLKSFWINSRFIVPPMSQDEMREAIEGPASARVLYFEPPDLVNQLINEVVQMPGALPLLSFTLSEMYIKYLKRRSSLRALTVEDYRELGGVIGSLRRRAKEEYDSLKSEQLKQTMRRVMLRMVALEGGEIARRKVSFNELNFADEDENDRVNQVVSQLIAARLLVKNLDAEGNSFVEPAHDALVRGWDLLLQWIHEEQSEQDKILLQRRVTQAAADWKKQAGVVWDDDPRLPQLTNILENNKFWFNQQETDFINSSIKQGRKNKLRRNILAGSTVALLSLAAVVSIIFGVRAQESQKQAEAERDTAQIERGRADNRTQEARQQRERADIEANAAIKQKNRADSEANTAKKEKSRAEEQTIIAKQQEKKAEENAAEAKKQQGFAENNAQEAKKQQKYAEENAAEAKRQLANLYEEEGRQLLLAENKTQALLYLNEAYKINDKTYTLRFLATQAEKVLSGQEITFDKHNQSIESVAVDADGTRLVTGSDDETAIVWNIEDGKPLYTLKGHAGTIKSVAFSPDGERLVTASQDGTAKLWNALNGNIIKDLVGHENGLNSAVFSSDGLLVVTAADDSEPIVWEGKTGKLLRKLKGHRGSVESAVFSYDGKKILTASIDFTARIWNAQTGECLHTLEGSDNWVNAAAFSPDGKLIISGGMDNKGRIWNAETGELITELKKAPGQSDYDNEIHQGPITSVSFTHDGLGIATASQDKTAKIWDSQSGELYKTLKGHNDSVQEIVVNKDDSKILTVSRDGTAKVWETETGKQLASFEAHLGEVNRALFLPNNKIVTGGFDNRAILWAIQKAQEAMPLILEHDNSVVGASFNFDGSLIVTASNDGKARIWETDGSFISACEVDSTYWLNTAFFSPNGKQIVVAGEGATAKICGVLTGNIDFSLIGHLGSVNSALYNPTGTRIVTASDDKTSIIWDAANGNLLFNLEGHNSPVEYAEYSRDGKKVVSASEDGTAKVWNAETGKLIFTLAKHKSHVRIAEFDISDRRILTASLDGSANIWDAATGKHLHSLEGHNGSIISASYSPDGSLVVTASSDETARVWNASNGELISILSGHSKSVKRAIFDNESKFIATASDDKTVKIWDARSGRLLTTLAGHGEWVEYAAFSPNNNYLITTSDDHSARIWNVQPQMKTVQEFNDVIELKIPLKFVQGRLIPKKANK